MLQGVSAFFPTNWQSAGGKEERVADMAALKRFHD